MNLNISSIYSNKINYYLYLNYKRLYFYKLKLKFKRSKYYSNFFFLTYIWNIYYIKRNIRRRRLLRLYNYNFIFIYLQRFNLNLYLSAQTYFNYIENKFYIKNNDLLEIIKSSVDKSDILLKELFFLNALTLFLISARGGGSALIR